MSAAYATVRTVGANLPPDVLARVLAGDRSLPGHTASDYHLGSGESAREAANRAWSYLTGTWATFTQARARLPEGDPAVGLTRERWLTLLFRELGYGRLPHTPAGGIVVGEHAFAVSHLWDHTPIHLLGWGVDLDKRTPGMPGAAGRAPQAMVQELLNRSEAHLWAVLSNGRQLRLLRDSTSLVGQSYVEFDLEAMFDGEVFSDFVLLFLLVHQSRVEVLSEGGPASDCWLERWRTSAAESGTRALGLLRDGVKAAIETLGTGFLRHPDNAGLAHRLANGDLTVEDYHRALLRLAYRLLFLFVAEDRDALLDPAAGAVARTRYADYFSTARLRRLAQRRRGTRHGDLWAALGLVLDALGREGGRPELGLPGLGGLFDTGPADVLTGLALPNDALLSAVRSLSVVQPKGQPKRTVDYRNLGAEELGGIYESLLELVPRLDAVERTFTLEALAGNERKTSGSYYTPTALIDLVLDTALDPLLDRAEKATDPTAALLALTVCDPACGSGHFLVAAARRIAERLATARTGDADPTPADLQAAMHDVVARCIYGVDVNPMAAELAKVSLWLEALQPGRPLTFLDAHVKVGNSLLGTTPALLAAGIPDAAFVALEGDDKKHALALKKRNATERDAAGQGELFAVATVDPGNRTLREEVARIGAAGALSLADVHLAEQRFRAFEGSTAMRQAVFEADAWCAAFVQTKKPGAPAITHATLTTPLTQLDPAVVAEVDRLAARHRFFHWHLEFPEIFDVPGAVRSDTQTGWHGGFASVIGNPPWDQVQLHPNEFFAYRAPEIADAPTMAKRDRLITKLADSNPGLLADFRAAQRLNDEVKSFVHGSDTFPLTAYGRLNTYSLFAEASARLVDPSGRTGVVTPTGLMTDSFNQFFAGNVLRSGRLAAFYDFENEAKIFAGVHNQFRFAVSSITGGSRVDRVSFAFYTRYVADVPKRRFDLSADEVLQLNPNTGTLPVFRSRVDAEAVLGIYRRHPVLIHERDPNGNPWHLSFQLMFMMNTSSHLFRGADDLAAEGAAYDNWAWRLGSQSWVPLYEAKMLGHYDHRFATYSGATQAQLNKGTLPRLSDRDHADPYSEPMALHWLAREEAENAIGGLSGNGWLMGWRGVGRASDSRTFIPSILPRTAVSAKFTIAYPTSARSAACLLSTWSSFAFDYVARQKLAGADLAQHVVKQLASPAPSTFVEPAPWQPDRTLAEFVTPRVLELTYTSHRIAPYARDLGDDGPPFRWLPERREALRAELDAAMFHVYGLTRPEVEHVLDSFFVVRKYEEKDHGEFRTKRLVLDRYDAMAEAIAALAAGKARPYATPLDPLPGEGPRHPRMAGDVTNGART